MTGIPAGIRVVGIRHHSPRSAAVVARVLEERRPELVLVEGPPELGPLVDVLTDPQTEPPVAALGYRTEGEPRASLWPFASYSPEYVALRWAQAAGARYGFVDLPVGVVLAGPGRGQAPVPEGPNAHDAALEAFGARSVDELWDSAFELPAHDPATFDAAVGAWAALVRQRWTDPYDAARDAWMAARIREAVDAGTDPERIVVVCGAAHAAAFAAAAIDPAEPPDLASLASLPQPVPCALTLVPFSFPRLSEQLGYGAGNRAPLYYQRAHDAGCDFERAGLEVLIDFTDQLRERGFAVSLADTIEAWRLARTLAAMRDRSGPGLDELREAAIATLCRGQAATMDQILGPALIGRQVGRVSERIGRNSLQEEFWREVSLRRLPRSDQAERFNLQLTNDTQVGTSVFLHRLRICEVPYATFQGTRTVVGFRSKDEAAGGIDALTRARETWSARWTPATELALVEQVVHGDTLEQVTTRRLDDRLASATSTGDAADVLLEATVTGCHGTAAAALATADRLATSDQDLPSLARACRALAGLAAYGTSRAAATAAIRALCALTFTRAVLRTPDAARGDDAAMAEVLPALRALHEIAVSEQVDGSGWFAAASGVVRDYGAHATAAGTCCGLLFRAQALDDAAVIEIVTQRLSDPEDPGRVARFLEGFLQVDAALLTRTDPVVAAIDRFMASLEPRAFVDVLPALRRAFGALSEPDRRYLYETLTRVRGLRGSAEARTLLDPRSAAQVAELDADLAAALDDLDDLF